MAQVGGSVLLTCTVSGSVTQTKTVTVPAHGMVSTKFQLDIAAAVEASKRDFSASTSNFLWGVATVDVRATAVGGWEVDAAAGPSWEERLSMNFETV